MNTSRLQSLVRLTADKRALSAQLKLVDEAIDDLQAELIPEFLSESVTSMSVLDDTGKRWVIYISTRTFARAEFLDASGVLDSRPELLTLQYAKAASLLTELQALGDEEGLGKLAAVGILPVEKQQLHVKKG